MIQVRVSMLKVDLCTPAKIGQRIFHGGRQFVATPILGSVA
jgi:hypothetical protein